MFKGLDLLALIESLGYAGVWTAVFLETGVLVFFFLPGDSMLFTAGFLASQDIMNIWMLIFGCLIAAVLGGMLSYVIGWKIGLKLFEKGDTRFLKRKHLESAQEFYRTYGSVAIITARFLPLVRPFVPFLAGVSLMPFRIFVLYNIIGAFIWVVGLTTLGFFFGKMLPAEYVDQFLLPIILTIIVISLMPVLYHRYKGKKRAAANKGEKS